MNENNFFLKQFSVPKDHRLVPTDDGTFTFESKLFTESCHSTGGAYQETLFNYVHGCNINQKLKNHHVNIFEVGLGVGLGPIATFVENKDSNHQINFFSTELDENLIIWLKESASEELNNIFPFRELTKINENELTYYQASSPNKSLTIYLGNCSKNISKIKKHLPQVHGIYQDPYSPKKNPELWTKDWFSHMKEISHPDIILSTYSASSSVKEALSITGWNVQVVKGFAKKRASIRAKLN